MAERVAHRGSDQVSDPLSQLNQPAGLPCSHAVGQGQETMWLDLIEDQDPHVALEEVSPHLPRGLPV